MDKRRLGRSELEVAPLCLGGNVFGWTIDEPTSFGILDGFTEAGFDFVDTADSYSAWVPGHEGGESERVIGAWLKARRRRGQVVIATKVGMWDRRKGLRAVNIKTACEESLTRLQTDYIDLYQAHADDAETPLDETLEAFADLIRAGTVRAVGASNYTAPRLKAALEASRLAVIPRYETLQPLYNLVERAFEEALQPLCVKEGIGVIPYFSLASGFLTGKYRTKADLGQSPRGGSAGKYLDSRRGPKVLAALDQVASGRGATPAAVALAWLRDRPAVTAPIASATSLEQLKSLVEGATLKLTAGDVAALDAASA
jgi:aryl-alcohol dehydrogenase-like predicted oxidoreductase